MKIYLFNLETGSYLGEDFVDEASAKRGAFTLPSDATTIAPPRVGPGEIPVFDLSSQSWKVSAVSGLRRESLAGILDENPSSEQPQ